MSDILSLIITVVVIGGPVLAWVVRVEKKLTEVCSALRHIHQIIEKRRHERGGDINATI